MPSFILIASLLVTAWSARTKRVGAWNAFTSQDAGMCAAHFRRETLPSTLPLYCSGSVSNLMFIARAQGFGSPRLRLYVDGKSKGSKQFPVFQGTRTWEVSHGNLSAGVHMIRYQGDRLSLKRLNVTGSGAGCSFIDIPGYDSASYTNEALDVVPRVMGPDRDFSDFHKHQLHFAHKTSGTTSDGKISATVISDGFWEWMFKYHQNQYTNDTWRSRIPAGKMYEESNIKPYLKISLGQVSGQSGDMEIIEPCNTVSNNVFHEAAVWRSCSDPVYTEAEHAVLTAGFSALAAGSGFFHASATKVGQLADRFAMQILMYQVHHLMLKSIISEAGSALTSDDRAKLLYLGKPAWAPTEIAEGLTSLFKQPYDREGWDAGLAKYNIPSYTNAIIAMILTWREAMVGNWPFYGPESVVNMVLDFLLGELDEAWVNRDYMPVLKKAFKTVKFCGDGSKLMARMLRFMMTFIDAFTYQEGKITVPDWVRSALDGLGFDSQSDMVDTWDIYNTQKKWCDERSLHAAWHEKAAHGLVIVELVVDLMIKDIKKSC